MSSPIAPTLAYIFLCHHERYWLQQCPAHFSPFFYKRYMNDTFVLFESQDKAELFLDYLNNKHPNNKFTIEIESERILPFVDTQITRTNNIFTCSTYIKQTFTVLGMNF